MADGTSVTETTEELRAGWSIAVPIDAVIPLSTSNPADPDSGFVEAPTASVSAPELLQPVVDGTTVVEDGDHFWSMSEEILTDAWGRKPTTAELTPFWNDMVEANRDGLLAPGDPSMVFAGQTMNVPPIPPSPDIVVFADGSNISAPVEHEVAAPLPLDSPASDEVPVPTHPDSVVDVAPTESMVEAPLEVTDTATELSGVESSRVAAESSTDDAQRQNDRFVAPVASVPSSGPAGSSVSGVAFDAAEGVDVVNEWHRSVWAGVAAGSLLLAGLGCAVRRFRLRRLARLGPGERIVDPPTVASGTELAITRSPEPARQLTTLRGLMQSITPYAAEQSDPPAVRAVQIGEDRVEVLFASPAPLPPKGWSTIDGSQSWTHRFDDEPVSSRQLLTPALVTIGRRRGQTGDQEVLLDLETAASVSITGDTDAAMGLARSMALELATYPLGVPMDLCLIGLHVDGTEVCDRVWQDTTLQRAVRTTREYVNAMAATGAASMMAVRSELAEDDGRHDPIVFIVNANTVDDAADRALLDELVDICVPSMGVAVVVVGAHANANEQIDVDTESKALWSQVSLTAPMVSLQAAAEAAVMLDHALNADSEPMAPSEMMVEMLAETDALSEPDLASTELGTATDTDGTNDEVPEYEYVAPTCDLLLRIMGNVRTEGIDLSANETELLGVLACLRGHASVDLSLVHEAIAPNRERKTVENRVSALRRRLGVGSNGEDLLPSIGPTNRYYELSHLVVSDVDLLEHRLHTAHELGSNDARRVLTAGLDLMEGPLFRAQKGFDGWPQSEGVVVAMTSIITNYALMLIDLAVEVDDFALVARTTAAAGRVLDNPVSEFPFRQKEEEYAEACGDDELVASVDAAREKLLAYLRDEDSLATP